MKILPVEKIREADAYTIEHEPIADIDLMERAAGACYEWIQTKVSREQRILVVCGGGNNGGDGFAIARMLVSDGYTTDVLPSGDPSTYSTSCFTNYQRLVAIQNQRSMLRIFDDETGIEWDSYDVILDALFGSGLTRPIQGEKAKRVAHLNTARGIVIAIDVPSGLYCDESTKTERGVAVVHADYTLTFSPPKLAFFFPENEEFVGKFHLLDIGLSHEYIDGVVCWNFLITHDDCRSILKKRGKFSHKGSYGHALLVAGSKGKMGAAVLSTKACLRSGVGLVTSHIPTCGIPVMQTAVPEAMVSYDSNKDFITEVPQLDTFAVIAAGPGLGRFEGTEKALKLLIQNASCPLILDADALNILSDNPTWLSFLPRGTIFTPHMKEFERLAGKSANDFDRNKIQRNFSTKYGIYVILKGAYTAVTTPEGNCYFNSTGNPGMATAGSGDTLTGILAGLKAQGYSSLEASILGVYLHGLAGDIAVEKMGVEALIASDIIENLGNAYKTLYG